LLNNLENINIYKSTFEVRIEKEKIKEIFSKFQANLFNNNLWKIDNINKKISKEFNSDQFISYSSYSSWIRKDKNIDAVINQYKDYEDNISIIKESNFKKSKNYPNYFTHPNPLSEFPKGNIAGTCLHKILERFEFRHDNNPELIDLIIEELNFHQIDTSLAFKVKDAILRIINISLGRELQNKKLVDIPNEYLIKELKYDLTLSYEGRNINSNDISIAFY